MQDRGETLLQTVLLTHMYCDVLVLILTFARGSLTSGKLPFNGWARAVAAATAAALAKAAGVGPTLLAGGGICKPRGIPGANGCSGKGPDTGPCCSSSRSMGLPQATQKELQGGHSQVKHNVG